MSDFISCDWGTSSFRLRLVNATTNAIIAESRSSSGIAETHALWNASGDTDRLSFYSRVITTHINLLQDQIGYLLNGMPVVVSGMASSGIGIIELPYQSIPFNISEADFKAHIIPASETCKHPLVLISGVCSKDDVMRGEETILAGCKNNNSAAEQLFIFPGTHSKHVLVQNGLVINLKTFMTGECFALLSKKSILATSVEKQDDTTMMDKAFKKGVKETAGANLLNAIFHVRTNQLFGKLSKPENYHFLSGLLIGEELKHIKRESYKIITLVSSGSLQQLYATALSIIAINRIISIENSEEALIAGQAMVYKKYKLGLGS